MLDVFVEQRIDLAAIGLGRIAEREQGTHFIEAHVERAATTHEGQTLAMLGTVGAVVSGRARGRRQQADAFVIADGLDRRGSRVREFSDLHGWICAMAR